jgi:hypothetical protein
MQKLVFPWKQAEASVYIELGMEVLVRICREQAHGTGLMLERQVLANAMPEP